MIICDSLTFAMTNLDGHVSRVQTVSPLLDAFQQISIETKVATLLATHANEKLWKASGHQVREESCLFV